MLKAGDPVPDFAFASETFGAISARALRGKRYVLYFYPKDDTPGCTREACGFRDNLPKFAGARVQIYGVSADDEKSHIRFSRKHQLPFKLIPDPERSIGDGAIAPWGALADEDRSSWHVGYRRETLTQLKVPMSKPWSKLSEEQRQLVLHGSEKRVKVNWTTANGEGAFNTRFDGVVNWLERTLRETQNEGRKAKLAQYYSNHLCSECGGGRLNRDSAAVKLGGRTLPEVGRMTIAEADAFFAGVGALHMTGPFALPRLLAALALAIAAEGLSFFVPDAPWSRPAGLAIAAAAIAFVLAVSGLVLLYLRFSPSILRHRRTSRKQISQ